MEFKRKLAKWIDRTAKSLGSQNDRYLDKIRRMSGDD